MRTRTFVLSFLVHATVIAAAMVVRILASTELPDPPRQTSLMMAAAELPPDVPPEAPRPQATAPAANPSVVPTEAPDVIAPEPSDIPDVAPSDGAIPGALLAFAGDVGIGPPAPPAARVAAPPPPPPAPQHIGGVIRPPQKIHHVPPTYPAIAQAAKITGTVILETVIAEDGSVRDVKVLRSVALLDAPAIDAVRQWRFTPTLLNGVPVPVIMSVTVTFTLR